MAKGSASASLLESSITSWIADNFYSCEGCTVPRWLLYELYIENCSPDCKHQVNPSSFGKLVRLVFPGLQTRRLGKRGSTRYHYNGIAIKSSSSFYARYCSLLSQNNHHSRNVCSSGDAPDYRSNSQSIRTSKTLHCFPTVIYLKTEQEMPWPELSSYCLWEQDIGKKYPYEMIALIANEYYSHCQDILHMVRNSEFNKVERCIMSFWRSLQPEGIALMCLPGVCKLFKSYDRQLFKEIENILFHDFLEEVSIQHMKSITLFSENIQVWLLNALEEFPLLIQTSKSEEVTLFIKRLKRKIDLSSMVKDNSCITGILTCVLTTVPIMLTLLTISLHTTMRKILNSNSKVTALRSNLHAVINQGLLEMPGNFFETNCKNPEELQIDIGVKCLNDLLPLLAPYTDIRVLLSCVSSNLQAFVIKPSRSKEEFRKLASDFQLRWNFLLSAVSKAMTLNCGHSFGHWHLFNLLLMDYVAHIFLSYTEEEDENFCFAMQNEPPVLWLYEPSNTYSYFAEEQRQADSPQTAFTAVTLSQNNFGLTNTFPEF